jgi:hypothetical protein
LFYDLIAYRLARDGKRKAVGSFYIGKPSPENITGKTLETVS